MLKKLTKQKYVKENINLPNAVFLNLFLYAEPFGPQKNLVEPLRQ